MSDYSHLLQACGAYEEQELLLLVCLNFFLSSGTEKTDGDGEMAVII